VRISVILCTYNRCQYLRNVLDSISSSEIPESIEWEVLIVDNNSTDQTPEVANEFAIRYPGLFRYILESRPGKSNALNNGIRESRGNVVAFLDDDVIVERTWLRNLTRALETGEWAGTGGRTLLREKFSPPRWLAPKGPYGQEYVFAALFDLGDSPCRLDRPPYGVNMAYRKEMFEKYGFFRTDLGPSPNREIPRPNEDTEFGRRLLSAGERLRYEPSAIVYHPLVKDRIRKDYFLSWWFDLGRASIRESGRRPDIWGIQRRYWSIPKIVIMMLTVSTFKWIFSVQPAKRFFNKCFVWKAAGQISEIYRQWGPDSAASEMNAACKAKS
jgi:glucosyl-dolichyl phosphate glucuronosyltransferase